MLKKIFTGCLIFIIGMIGYAQNTIRGTIFSQGQKGLAGSHIHIGAKTVTADANGKYEVKNIASGSLKVFVSYVGYDAIDTLVTIREDLILDFVMKP